MTAFYGDWIFYGGIAAVIGMCITVCVLGNRYGVEYFTAKRSAITIAVFLIPSILLPLLLMPGITVLRKIGLTVALTCFCALRYIATTKSQRAIAEMRERDKKMEQSD